MKRHFAFLLLFAPFFLLSSCGSDEEDEPNKSENEPTLTKVSYSLSSDGQEQILGTNISYLAWFSENEFVATVENGVIKAQYVGSTMVRSLTNDLRFAVTVNPLYNTYEEPSTDWGASIATIKSIYGTPYSEDDTFLIYKTANTSAPLMLFSFDDEGGLSSSGVLCKVSIASELAKFLTERYVTISIDKSNYTAYLLHCSGKIDTPEVDYVVGMQYKSSVGGILVAYVPNDASSKSTDVNVCDALPLPAGLAEISKHM